MRAESAEWCNMAVKIISSLKLSFLKMLYSITDLFVLLKAC